MHTYDGDTTCSIDMMGIYDFKASFIHFCVPALVELNSDRNYYDYAVDAKSKNAGGTTIFMNT